MRPSKAINEVVKKHLEESFGGALTARILFTARDRASAPIVGMSTDNYRDVITAIGEDERVVEMWGAFGVRSRVERWSLLMKETDI